MNRSINKLLFLGIILLSSSALYSSHPAFDMIGCKKDGVWTSFEKLYGAKIGRRFTCEALGLKGCKTDPFCISGVDDHKIKADSKECQNARIGNTYLAKYLDSTYSDQKPYRKYTEVVELLTNYINDKGKTDEKQNAKKIAQDASEYIYIGSFPGCSLDGICQENYFQNTALAKHACKLKGLEFATKHIPASGPVVRGRLLPINLPRRK